MKYLISEEFRQIVSEKFDFLLTRGFVRAEVFDRNSPTGASVSYVGKFVGFDVELDIRDQCIDVLVVKVVDGQMMPYFKGGYSCVLDGFLRDHAGFVEGLRPPVYKLMSIDWEHRIEALANLLREEGEILLSDSPDSIPARQQGEVIISLRRDPLTGKFN